jgi:hypothetical protein
VPSSRTEQGHWQGINYTWYGLLTANGKLKRDLISARLKDEIEGMYRVKQAV